MEYDYSSKNYLVIKLQFELNDDKIAEFLSVSHSHYKYINSYITIPINAVKEHRSRLVIIILIITD